MPDKNVELLDGQTDISDFIGPSIEQGSNIGIAIGR